MQSTDGNVLPALATVATSCRPTGRVSQKHRTLTTVTDLRGGLVTFLGSAYIVVLIPAMLRADASSAPMTTVAATALACAFGSALFAMVARLPFAVGPGIVPASIIAAFLASGIPFPVILGIEFFAGLLFLIIALSGGIKTLVSRMSPVLKAAGQIAIGLYLFLAALKAAGILPGVHAAAASGMGTQGLIFLIGLAVVLGVTNSKRYRGYAILLGITVAVIGAAAFGFSAAPTTAFALPDIRLFAPDVAAAFDLQYLDEMLILLYVVIVDVVATLETIAVCSPEMRDTDGRPKHFDRSILMSALLFLISPFLGTAPLVIFFESLGGVLSGARTVRASMVMVVGFVVLLFFAPLANAIPAFACAVALGYIGYAITKYAAMNLPMDPNSLTIARQGRYLAGTAIIAMLVTQSIALTIFCLFAAYPISALKSGQKVHLWEYLAALVCSGFVVILLH